MKLTVLGCSGGIGGAETRTSSFLVDDDVLIDCGTGVGDLELDALHRINHVFVSHSHLDHIAAIPLLVDSLGDTADHSITIHAAPETLHVLRAHVFNWLVWPDFTTIPNRRYPYLNLHPIAIGEATRLDDRIFTALPILHTVPSAAWMVDDGKGQIIYSGDTTYSSEFIDAINQCTHLRYLILETALPNEMVATAMSARHLCPSMLGLLLDELTVSPEVYISHLKSGMEDRIMEQIDSLRHALRPTRLYRSQIIET